MFENEDNYNSNNFNANLNSNQVKYLQTKDEGHYDIESNQLFVFGDSNEHKNTTFSSIFNVNNFEIQENLKKFEFVEDAIVLGYPHPVFGSIPKAFITLKKKLANPQFTFEGPEESSSNGIGYQFGDHKNFELQSQITPANENEERELMECEFNNEKEDNSLNDLKNEFENKRMTKSSSFWKSKAEKRAKQDMNWKIASYLDTYLRKNFSFNAEIGILDKFPIVKSKWQLKSKPHEKKIDIDALLPKEKPKNATFFGALMNSVNSSIGIDMFALPYTLSRMGVVSGICCAIFFGIMTGLTQKISVGFFC